MVLKVKTPKEHSSCLLLLFTSAIYCNSLLLFTIICSFLFLLSTSVVYCCCLLLLSTAVYCSCLPLIAMCSKEHCNQTTPTNIGTTISLCPFMQLMTFQWILKLKCFHDECKPTGLYHCKMLHIDASKSVGITFIP